MSVTSDGIKGRRGVQGSLCDRRVCRVVSTKNKDLERLLAYVLENQEKQEHGPEESESGKTGSILMQNLTILFIMIFLALTQTFQQCLEINTIYAFY